MISKKWVIVVVVLIVNESADWCRWALFLNIGVLPTFPGTLLVTRRTKRHGALAQHSVSWLLFCSFSSEAGSYEAKISEDTSTTIGKEEGIPKKTWLVAIIIIIYIVLGGWHGRKHLSPECNGEGGLKRTSVIRIWNRGCGKWQSPTTGLPVLELQHISSCKFIWLSHHIFLQMISNVKVKREKWSNWIILAAYSRTR